MEQVAVYFALPRLSDLEKATQSSIIYYKLLTLEYDDDQECFYPIYDEWLPINYILIRMDINTFQQLKKTTINVHMLVDKDEALSPYFLEYRNREWTLFVNRSWFNSFFYFFPYEKYERELDPDIETCLINEVIQRDNENKKYVFIRTMCRKDFRPKRPMIYIKHSAKSILYQIFELNKYAVNPDDVLIVFYAIKNNNGGFKSIQFVAFKEDMVDKELKEVRFILLYSFNGLDWNVPHPPSAVVNLMNYFCNNHSRIFEKRRVFHRRKLL